MAKLLQNKISESNFTLPIAAVYGCLLWLVSGLITQQFYIQFVMFALSVALVVELNNRNALLRIRSRMVSVSYILQVCMANFMFGDIIPYITALGMVVVLTLLFFQYHDTGSQGYVFYTFAVISIVSLFWIQMLFFVPFIWMLMVFYIQSMSWKSFAASLIGIIAPYWFAGAYCFIFGDFDALLAHVMGIAQFQSLFSDINIQLNQILTFFVVVLLAVIGFVHYVRNSFLDKIHNRMLYYCFAWLDVVAAVFMVLQPQHYNNLMIMMMVFTSPIIAHFIALTSTRWTNVVTWVIAVVVVLITIFNLWTPFLIYS